jgi:hypothetical protein
MPELEAGSVMTQTIEIPLPEELLRLVDEKAHSRALNRDEYIRSVLAKDVTSFSTVSEILAPFRDEVAADGVSEGELSVLFSEAREETYRSRNRS